MLCVGILLLAIVAGCGGDDEGDSTTVTTSSLSKAEFTAKAEDLCFQEQEQMASEIKAVEEQNGVTEPLDLSPEAVTAAVLPRMETQIEELQALGAPKGDEDQIEAFLAAMSQALGEIEDRQLSSSAELSRAFGPVKQLGRKYGFEACAYG